MVISISRIKMQAIVRGTRSCQETYTGAILKHCQGKYSINLRLKCLTSSPEEEKGLENVTVSDVLKSKGEDKVGSWIWCRTDDIVDDAAKNVSFNIISEMK